MGQEAPEASAAAPCEELQMRDPDVLHFLEEIKSRPEVDRLVALGFFVESPRWTPRNAVLKLWKKSWMVPVQGDPAHHALIHFETRRREVPRIERGEVRLEVDHVPYVPRISVKPEQLIEYHACLKLKAALLSALRECVMEEAKLVSETRPSVAHLCATDHPDTQCAIKFRSGLGVDPPVEAYSRWLAKIVQRVTPLVDVVVSQHNFGPATR
jgi:hypothetical protein